MAFGKREMYGNDIIEYTESIDMLLNDLKMMGYKGLTKERLNEILTANNFSIGRAVRFEIDRILDLEKFRLET